MSTITIIQGNNNDKDNTRAYMVKGESGVSPTVSVERITGGVTVTATDYTGEHTAQVNDGVSPTVEISKTAGVTTITITDYEGTHTATINDGEVTNASLATTLLDYIQKENFVVVTGTITGNNESPVSATLSYPAGFTKDNCVVVSYALKNSTQTSWAIGTVLSLTNLFGSMPISIYLEENDISVSLKNINISDNTLPSVNNITATFDIKLVLMKVS